MEFGSLSLSSQEFRPDVLTAWSWRMSSHRRGNRMQHDSDGNRWRGGVCVWLWEMERDGENERLRERGTD